MSVSDIAGARVAHQALLRTARKLRNADIARPSRLPDWSRGHVATHIARQADGLVRLTEWARTGQRQDMYASAEMTLEVMRLNGELALKAQGRNA